MQPARLDLRVDKGATFRAVLRIMQPSLIYKAITAIAATAPVQLTVEHGLPTDWPVWVEQAQQLQALNRAPLRTAPHMARVIDADTLEINTINAAGTNAKGGQLIYQAPLDLTGATAVLQLLEGGTEVGTLPVTVNAGGWLDVALTPAQTAALDWAEREYVVDVNLESGEVLRAFAGTVAVVLAGASAGQVCSGSAVVGGDRGPAGPTIAGATVAENGHLILTLEDGTQIDAGVIDRPWGTIQGEITEQLDLMYQLGLKVNQDTYDAFVVATSDALADRYTKAESDARYDAAGTASGAVGAHEAAPDPHPQYTTAAEAAASAPVQSVQGRQGAVVITTTDLNLQNVDNTSDEDKPLSDAATAALALKLDAALKGASNGVAELDNNGKVPLSQINDAVLGQMSYQGLWDAGTNTPALPGTPANQGDYYVTSAPGTQFGLTFATGDWLVANGTAWGKVDNTDAVSTVQGRTGNVVITKADVGLGSVDDTSDADKPVSTAQAAALAGKVGTGDSRLSDPREWTAETVGQAEAEAGVATTRRAWTAQRVRQAILGWWNGATSLFGRSFVASADADVGRSALGLGTLATANYNTLPLLNLMPDSGRFAGKMNPLSLTAGAFQSSPLLPGLNGGTHASGGKFSHNNGGTSNADILALLAAVGRTGRSTLYGVEFHIDEYTCGAGTTSATVGLDGITRYLALSDTSGRAVFQAGGYSTFAAWIRVTEGSAHATAAGQEVNGIASAQRRAFTPADGFFHFRCVQYSDTGYYSNHPGFAGLEGTKIQVALAVFYGGIANPGLHKSPIPANNELMA